MTDEIRTLTQRLADEPSSLAFLELGETLRRRGQLDAACKVTRAGLTRYPGLADAHDLLGRILSDQGDLAGAFDAWADALRFDPMRTGALKGIAFLYFRAGDVAAALDHLQRAAEADPDDPAIPQAIARVRRDAPEAGRAGLPAVEEPAGPDRHQEAPAPAGEGAVAEADVRESDAVQASPAAPPAPAEADRAIPRDSPFAGIAEDERGLLLADASGQRLGGDVGGHGMESGDRVAAQLAGLSREAARATTVLLVRRGSSVCMASDGQVTVGNTVVKAGAAKVRRAAGGKVLVGFAGGAADGLALYARLDAKLEEYGANLERAVVELAKEWRTDRALRQLQAQMVVCDRGKSFLISGSGDLLQPDDGVLAIGSGSNFALAAARALLRHTELGAREVVAEAMRIAAEICIYTNDRVTIEELPSDAD